MQLWRCLTNLAPVPLSRDVVEFKIRNQTGMNWLCFENLLTFRTTVWVQQLPTVKVENIFNRVFVP